MIGGGCGIQSGARSGESPWTVLASSARDAQFGPSLLICEGHSSALGCHVQSSIIKCFYRTSGTGALLLARRVFSMCFLVLAGLSCRRLFERPRTSGRSTGCTTAEELIVAARIVADLTIASWGE